MRMDQLSRFFLGPQRWTGLRCSKSYLVHVIDRDEIRRLHSQLVAAPTDRLLIVASSVPMPALLFP
jgi:hypothetical protein